MRHTPTKAMQGAAKKGIAAAKGKKIDSTHIVMGRKIASGQGLADEHVHAIADMHSSHDCSGADTSCLLMGGPAGAQWSASRSSAINSTTMAEAETNHALISLSDDDLSLEIYVQGGIGEDVLLGEDGFVWAPILRSGTLALRPGPNGQKVAEPLVFVPGLSTNTRKEIGLQNLVDAFESDAVQHVTIPTTHENSVLQNTGYIRGLKIVDSKRVPGQKVLMAAHDFTEPDVKARIERGSIANRSCGILYDHADTETGTVYPQVLEHVALTNKPWVRGMTAYGEVSEEDFSERTVVPMLLSEGTLPPILTASEGARSKPAIENSKKIVVSTRLSTEEIRTALDLADVAWGDQPSLNMIQSGLAEHFRSLRPDGECGYPYYSVIDCGLAQALVQIDYGSDGDPADAWVVPFSLDGDNKPVVSDFSQWTPVERAWIADEDAATDRDELAKIMSGARAGTTDFSDTTDPTPRDHLSEQNERGGAMPPTIKEVIGRLDLSDEAKSVFERLATENEQTKALLSEATKVAKKDRVTAKVKELQDAGFPSGFCASYETIALSDDGQVATVLHLSDGGTMIPVEQTATQIADRLVAALPKDESGKLALADRGNLLENPLTARPAVDAEQQAKVEGKAKKPLTGDEYLAEMEAASPGVTAALHLSNGNGSNGQKTGG